MFTRTLRLLTVVCLFGALPASAAVLYVDINSTNPVSPFSSWATAATNIQDAVDAAANYDKVLVTNGIFQSGGRPAPGQALTNRLVVTNAICVQSVNGPAATVIEGFQVPGATNGPGAVRCVYLSDGAQLDGFTLTNGAAFLDGSTLDESGGGVACPDFFELVSNCVITGNCASFYGAGAYWGTLNQCTLSGNAVVPSVDDLGDAKGDGGGAAFGMLDRCVLTNNSASFGGGAFEATLDYCLLVGNTSITPLMNIFQGGSGGGANSCFLFDCLLTGNYAAVGGGGFLCEVTSCTVANNYATIDGGGVVGFERGYVSSSIVYNNCAPAASNYDTIELAYSCTTPLPPGFGNITNAPLFVNPAGGDFHLQSNSPCINSGDYSNFGTDLDGNPRVSGGTVDMGAYEFQNPASIISYAWLEQYGLPTDGSADFLDTDHDGMNNWQEWIAGTDPTNPSSVLLMFEPFYYGTNLIVSWQSEPNVTYFIQRATNLFAQPAFQSLAPNFIGQVGTTYFVDTNAPAPGPYFYRVGVQQP